MQRSLARTARAEFEYRTILEGTLAHNPTISSQLQALVTEFAATGATLGFFRFGVVSLRQDDGGPTGFFIGNVPAPFRDAYFEKKWYLGDPAAKVLGTRASPFWASERMRRVLAERQPLVTAMFDLMKGCEIDDCFVIPVRSPLPSSRVTLMTRDRALQSDAHILHEAVGHAVEFFDRLIEMVGRRTSEQVDGVASPHGLSGREIQCLRWVMAGKSDTEIAQIMTLSSHTVRWHLKNAKRKLGARRISQALVTATKAGIIE